MLSIVDGDRSRLAGRQHISKQYVSDVGSFCSHWKLAVKLS